MDKLKKEIRKRFMALTEEEKNLIRQNRETPYAKVLRKVLGEELLSGLRVANSGQKLNNGGIAGLRYAK
jgi:hypothetical protein|tara:strand:+ start:309 stop:515 length:207 start_codon:yes stop_codon:yes gene_type:complete